MSSNAHFRFDRRADDRFRSRMKGFLTRKKAPEPLIINDGAQYGASQTTLPQVSPSNLKKSNTNRWKRNKKPVEAKPELDLTAVLPSNEEFRTSLLMPAFSARFSMLREQDDPKSILGKASDDSVLQPRRRSRIDFGLGKGTLGDIAEIDANSRNSSLRNSIRPPFAYGRQESFGSEDGYNSEVDSSSILGRARPGEGNTMFGGRQKVYMIPKSGAASSRSLGRPVYEDDIGMSRFQRYRREREAREQRDSDESQGFEFGLDQAGPGDQEEGERSRANDSAKDLSHSPSLSSFEKKRSTNYSSRSEARSSTAATSIVSQPLTGTPSPAPAQSQYSPATAPSTGTASLKRADTKTRRLYEQGLDQHMLEQQTSSMTRLNSIQRQRSVSAKQQPHLHGTRSTGNLHEKSRPQVYALESKRSPSATGSRPILTTAWTSSAASPDPSVPTSPVSPLPLPGTDMDGTSTLSQALEPGDRGKATALGAFNKPNQSFDEDQYMERQRQLQRSASNAAVRKNQNSQATSQQRHGRFEQERDRSYSSTSARSRSRSVPKKHNGTQAFGAYNRAARVHSPPGLPLSDRSILPDTHRTFFGNISASESDEEDNDDRPLSQQNTPEHGYGTNHGRWQPGVLSSVLEHPALRSKKLKTSIVEEDEDVDSKPSLTLHPPQPTATEPSVQTLSEQDFVSSPLDDGIRAAPIGSMMHHLRQRSNVSSNDERDRLSTVETIDSSMEASALSSRSQEPSNTTMRSLLVAGPRPGATSAASDPWALEDADRAPRRVMPNSEPPVSPIGREDGGPSADFLGPVESNRRSAVSSVEAEHEQSSSWQDELLRQHSRNASTETQQERSAFANELAARRAAIQENMKSLVERDPTSRGESPAPSSTVGFKAFGGLRSKPSSDSMDSSRMPAKAMKIFGVTANTNGGSSHASVDRDGQSSEFSRARDDAMSRPPVPNNQPRAAQQFRSRKNSEADPGSASNRSPVSSSGGRSRANSTAPSGRARGKTGPYRDDLDKAMHEGTGSSAAGVADLSPMIPQQLTPTASPDIVQSHFESSRARSNSKSAITSYFDAKILQSGHTGDRFAPSAGSPAMLSPNVFSSASSTGARSPVGSPFLSNMTPPLSGSNTPMSSTFSPPSSATLPQFNGRPNGLLRKMTVSKSDISEPTFISSTSNVELINLPAGASLQNGMEERAPSVPPMNPRRRGTKGLFSLGRKDSAESTAGLAANSRSKTPDLLRAKSPDVTRAASADIFRAMSPDPDLPLDMPGAFRDDGDSPPRNPPVVQHDFHSGAATAAAASHNTFVPNTGSPERAQRQAVAVGVDGGMF